MTTPIELAHMIIKAEEKGLAFLETYLNDDNWEPMTDIDFCLDTHQYKLCYPTRIEYRAEFDDGSIGNIGFDTPKAVLDEYSDSSVFARVVKVTIEEAENDDNE